MTEPTPEHREYVHDRCHLVTIVTGSDFTNLASPLNEFELTYCSACKGMFGVGEFAWRDTGETIPDYRRRHAGDASAVWRWIGGRKGIWIVLALSIILGGMSAATLADGGWPEFMMLLIGGSLLAFIATASLLLYVLTPIAHKRVCGVADPRRLD